MKIKLTREFVILACETTLAGIKEEREKDLQKFVVEVMNRRLWWSKVPIVRFFIKSYPTNTVEACRDIRNEIVTEKKDSFRNCRYNMIMFKYELSEIKAKELLQAAKVATVGCLLEIDSREEWSHLSGWQP